jgi:multiple sugar transport system permease protein
MTDETLRRLFLALGGILLVGITLTPVALMAATSVSRDPGFLSSAAPFDLTLLYYRGLFASTSLHFADTLRNSFVVAALTAIASSAIAAVAAYAVTRFDFPGRLPLLVAVLALSMFPQISLVGPLFRMLARLGWLNTPAALVFPYIAWTLPLSLWILVSYFSRIPRELDRAALVDGCTPWQALRLVILPVAMPGIVSTALLAFITAFNEFLFALMFTTDHHGRTMPVTLALFEGLHGEIPWGPMMAASMIAAFPVLALTLLFQRRIVGGLTRGAIKG